LNQAKKTIPGTSGIKGKRRGEKLDKANHREGKKREEIEKGGV